MTAGRARRFGAPRVARNCAATGCRHSLVSSRMQFCSPHYAALSRDLRHELARITNEGRYTALTDFLGRARAYIAAAPSQPSSEAVDRQVRERISPERAQELIARQLGEQP